MPYATVTASNDGSLAYRSSYDPALVDELKRQIPYNDRRWDPDNKQWLIAPQHLATLERITDVCLGVQLQQSGTVHAAPPQIETKIFRVDYIGAPKERDDGSQSAFGYADGDWKVVFPQDVLKNWFELGATPDDEEQEPVGATTLYGLLGVSRAADERAIKKAFRKMAKRWHPDVSQEPDAPEMMKRINDAYQVLGDQLMRKKYDAGLQLEESLQRDRQPRIDLSSLATLWRPPVRCGYLMVEGYEQLGRFHVKKILKWEDIVDDRGRVCVTSWPAGASHFVVNWV